MRHAVRLVGAILVVAACGLILPRRSLAYLDPSTGSYVLQMLLALLVGGAFAIKIFWKRIVGVFRRQRPAASAPEPVQGQTKDEDQPSA